MSLPPEDLESALAAFVERRGIDRDAAVAAILEDWFRSHGYLPDRAGDRAAGAESEADPEFVQYPAYFKNGSL